MWKEFQILWNSLKIGKNKEKSTDVSHFDEQPAMYKNFWGMKAVWDLKNTSRGREYQKMKKIVGGTRARLKSAQIFLMNEKIPRVHDFWFS